MIENDFLTYKKVKPFEQILTGIETKPLPDTIEAFVFRNIENPVYVTVSKDEIGSHLKIYSDKNRGNLIKEFRLE